MVKLGQPAMDLLKRLYEHSDRDISVLKELLSGTPRCIFVELDLSGPEYRANGTYYNALQNFKKSFMKEGVLEQRVVEYCNENNPPAAAPDTAGNQAPPAADPSLNGEVAVAGGAPTAAAAGDDAANVSHGAGAGRTGDGPSHEDMMKELALRTAQLEFKSAEVKLQMNEEISAMNVDTQGRLNKNEIAISDNKVAISEVQVAVAEVGATAKNALESSKNANERVDGLTDTVKGLKDTVKKILLSNPANSDEGAQLARLVGDASYSPTPSRTAPAADDESDDNFDEVEVNNNIITPAPGQTSLASRLFPDDAAAAPVHADNYKAFLRHLKDARLYGQDGREVEMNSSLKKAEHIMLNTKLNEERNRWHTEFNNMSKCARRLCSQYGLKPAAR